jgi:very-short-patch-repair endonuclease
MGRRYGRYRNNSYSDPWEGDCYEAFPRFKIVCETENHIGFINVPPKKEYQNPKGYALIDAELHKISKIRLSYIQTIEKSGITQYTYKRPENLIPESDMGWHGNIKIKGYRKCLLFLFIENLNDDYTDKFVVFLRKFFSDPAGVGNINISLSIEGTGGNDAGQKLQKRKHHSRYNTPHKQAKESPIEKLFREELQRKNIIFEEQVEIVLENKKFSVPDFVLRNYNLLIYCDGTEFHKSPERIIMDKQQDRTLQTNGFTVFRFSGSEIGSNVRSCVDEVMLFMHKKDNPEDIHDKIAKMLNKKEPDSIK